MHITHKQKLQYINYFALAFIFKKIHMNSNEEKGEF